MPARRRTSLARAMSLIEIMVVITLIGLVTAVVGVGVFGVMGDGQDRLARSQAYEIDKSLDVYRLQHGSYPSMSEGIDVLTTPPRGRPILAAVPRDPWGGPFGYAIPGVENPGRLDVRSSGVDRTPMSADDVGNWPER